MKRKTSPIKLPIRLPTFPFNRLPPKKEEKEGLININQFGALGVSQDMMTKRPFVFPTMPLLSRYYLPSKSLHSYNTDTGVQVQKDDYLDYADTELKAPEA